MQVVPPASMRGMEAFIKEYLLTPGPTPLPEEVQRAMSHSAVYHRSEDFINVYKQTEDLLADVFGERRETLLLASSGTGALESVVENMLGKNEQGIVLSAGKFGERWAEIVSSQGKNLAHKKFPWGEQINLEKSQEWLERQEGSVLFLTLSETSTGVVHDLQPIIDWAKRRGLLVAVDAISALGTMQMPSGTDAIASGSQKALQTPPGLGLLSLSNEAAKLSSGYYWSWDKAIHKKPGSPFTPATHLVFALRASLLLMHDEGLENVYKRHETLGRAARAGVEALGLKLFGQGESPVLTSFYADSDLLVKVRSFGAVLAGGQDEIKGKVMRLAHCGYFGAFDVIVALSALEMALGKPGVGVAAAEEVLL